MLSEKQRALISHVAIPVDFVLIKSIHARRETARAFSVKRRLMLSSLQFQSTPGAKPRRMVFSQIARGSVNCNK